MFSILPQFFIFFCPFWPPTLLLISALLWCNPPYPSKNIVILNWLIGYENFLILQIFHPIYYQNWVLTTNEKTISSWLKKQTYKKLYIPWWFEKKYIQLFYVCAKVQHFFATKNQVSRFWLLNNQLMLLLVLENTFVVCIG